MLLSAVSVLVVAQSSSEIPEGLMNKPVYDFLLRTAVCIFHPAHLPLFGTPMQVREQHLLRNLFNVILSCLLLTLYFFYVRMFFSLLLSIISILISHSQSIMILTSRAQWLIYVPRFVTFMF